MPFLFVHRFMMAAVGMTSLSQSKFYKQIFIITVKIEFGTLLIPTEQSTIVHFQGLQVGVVALFCLMKLFLNLLVEADGYTAGTQLIFSQKKIVTNDREWSAQNVTVEQSIIVLR